MIDRRGFFRLAAGAGTASLAAACKWDGGDALRPRLLDISRVNDWVGEKLLYSPSRLAREYATTERTANVPSYFISRTMPLLQNPAAWRLRVDGLVRRPLDLSLDDLTRMPRTSWRLTCVAGRQRWSASLTPGGFCSKHRH